MTRTIFTLLLAATLVLAGGVSAGGLAQETTTDGDATETPIDESTNLPPGVTEDGVSNATALLEAHQDALAATGYEFESRSNYSMGGVATVSEQSGTVAKAFFPYVSHADATVERGNQTVEYDLDQWGNESLTLVRIQTENRTQYQKLFYEEGGERSPSLGSGGPFVNRSDVEASVSGTGLIASALAMSNFTVESVETVDGHTLTTLRAEEVNESGGFGTANVSQFDGTLVVDERGLVREVNVSMAFESGFGGENRLAYHFEIVRTGPVVVQRPAWTDEALESSSARISIDSEETYFTVTNRGGDRLPNGTEIQVSHGDVNTTLTLEQSLRPGETAYVYFPAEGGEPVLTRGQPEEGVGAEVRGDYEFTVVDPTGNVVGQFGIGRGVSTATAGSETPAENETATATTTNATTNTTTTNATG